MSVCVCLLHNIQQLLNFFLPFKYIYKYIYHLKLVFIGNTTPHDGSHDDACLYYYNPKTFVWALFSFFGHNHNSYVRECWIISKSIKRYCSKSLDYAAFGNNCFSNLRLICEEMPFLVRKNHVVTVVTAAGCSMQNWTEAMLLVRLFCQWAASIWLSS